MGERFFMKWNQYSVHITQSLQEMRSVEELFDVTLACDDGKQLEAHKVILSACSPIFRQMMARNSHPHPHVFMAGVNSKEMENILDYLYQGEVQVDQEDLLGFLSIGKKLKIHGL